jgi:hypothetical protein
MKRMIFQKYKIIFYYKIMSIKKTFELNELPSAYFCDNEKSNDLRKEMIKNQLRISENNQTELESIFFCDKNIDLINKLLILAVFKKSNGLYKISYQDKKSLIIVMRYIFLEYALHLPYDIDKQIYQLNKKVVMDILPNVLTNISQKIDYLKEINSPRQLLPLPINVKNNNRNLPSSFIY